MRASYRLIVCAIVFVVAGLGASRLFSREHPLPASQASAAAPHPQKSSAAAASQGDVERGRYLVEDVAMCEECHTPRDPQSNLDESRRLQGAAIWIVPVHSMTNWANRAPALAGLPGFTDSQAQDILENGVGPNGLPIQPPMHIYHMARADAQAIIAYLRSLPATYPRYE
jgi:mono/diheme cytochrome c family protein